MACAVLAASGCVQRRLTIRSSPPGALVYIDDYEIGTTPCSTDYIYYGTRKFRLVRDGYETLVVEQRIRPPWYEVFPLDFASENLWPGEVRDERTLNFQLMPQRITPTGEVLGRAENLRLTSRAGITAPIPLPGDGVTGPTVIPGLTPTPTQPPRTGPGYLEPGFVPRGGAGEGLAPPPPAVPSYSLPAPSGGASSPPPPTFLPPSAVQPSPPPAMPASPFDAEPPGGWQPPSGS